MAFRATPPSSRSIIVDTDPGHGGRGLGPEPTELLLVALGSCTAMDVISILRKKRQVVSTYHVNVYANQTKTHPKVFTDILVEHVVGGPQVAPEAVARSIELSITRYCPVHAMLSKAARVEHVYRILDTTQGLSPEEPGLVK